MGNILKVSGTMVPASVGSIRKRCLESMCPPAAFIKPQTTQPKPLHGNKGRRHPPPSRPEMGQPRRKRSSRLIRAFPVSGQMLDGSSFKSRSAAAMWSSSVCTALEGHKFQRCAAEAWRNGHAQACMIRGKAGPR